MIRERVKAAQIAAMKAKDKERTAATRSILAKIKDKDIELRGKDSALDDDITITDVLQKMAKQRRESIAMYNEGGRTELAENETFELSVIEEFLPAMLSDDEVKAIIDQLKAETGAEGMKDMGKLMGALKSKYGSVIDMGKAGAWVKDSLK